MAKMSSEDQEKNRGFVVAHHHESHESYPPPPFEPPHELPPPPPPPYYGTFQGVPTYPPPFGFPQPAPPAGSSDPNPQYYSHAYQSVPGYAVAEGQPIRERRLPCCGIGLGWCLFILGFFFAGIPWYVGAILLICSRRTLDYREKPGYVLCTIAALLVTVAIVLGATKGDDDWIDW